MVTKSQQVTEARCSTMRCAHAHCERKEKTTPVGIKLMRSQVVHQAAQVLIMTNGDDNTCCMQCSMQQAVHAVMLGIPDDAAALRAVSVAAAALTAALLLFGALLALAAWLTAGFGTLLPASLFSSALLVCASSFKPESSKRALSPSAVGSTTAEGLTL